MKKGRFSGKEGLERRQVEHRRVYLNLAEVGVDRGVEGEVRGQSVLEVQANARGGPGVRVERAPPPGWPAMPSVRRRRAAVEVRGGGGNAQPGEVAKARRAAGGCLGRGDPVVLLVAPLRTTEPPHLQPPRLHRIARKAELAERNPHLGRPSGAVDSPSPPPRPGPTRRRSRRCRCRCCPPWSRTD